VAIVGSSKGINERKIDGGRYLPEEMILGNKAVKRELVV
jgi:hypothetical protein